MQPPSGGARAGAEEDELLGRSDSAGRRRRSSPVQSASPKPPGWGGPRRQSSFRHDVRHAASETYLVTRLTFTLLQCLGLGYRWMSQLLALTIYAILLMPGFLQVGYYYFFSSQVRRSIVYGEQPRNRLDLYIPKDNSRPCPVVAFVTGGAWIIGYKAWGALLGRRLAERGIIVACIDYRNFPQGTISDMVSDASQGISFVCNNIASYGGDPNQIYLMGQSAGAHIAACALMEQAVKESSGQPISWSVTQIKAYFGLSGGYNIHNLVDHFHERGLYRSIFLSIMEGEESLSHYSPEIVAKQSNAQTIALLPLIVLMHGTEDYSIPSSASQTFVDVLRQTGAQAKLLLYEGKTHTDLFLQVSPAPGSELCAISSREQAPVPSPVRAVLGEVAATQSPAQVLPRQVVPLDPSRFVRTPAFYSRVYSSRRRKGAAPHGATTPPSAMAVASSLSPCSRKAFINKLSKKTCRLLSTPCTSRKRPKLITPKAPPRRSRRLAGVGVDLPAEPNPSRTKKRVMRALHIIGEKEGINQEALVNYAKTFEQPISAAHMEALAALFGWATPECEASVP